MSGDDNFLFSSNPRLLQKAEFVEGRLGVAYAEAFARLRPSAEVAWRPFAGGWAVFAGADSPMTHVVGAGLHGRVEASQLDDLERFHRERGAPTTFDLCPAADASLLRLIGERDYRLGEFNNLVVREIRDDEDFRPPADWEARPAGAGDSVEWGDAMLEGFIGPGPYPEDFRLMGQSIFAMDCGRVFWGRRDGRRAGTAAMASIDDWAIFFGDSTLESARKQGCQSALIAARLELARRQGRRFAMASVLPGSGSNRNYERAGFRALYTRAILSLAPDREAAGQNRPRP